MATRPIVSKRRVKALAGGPLKAFPRSHRRISGKRFGEGAMAQEFEGTFVHDSHGCEAGVFATTTYCPEVAEDQEQVFGRDPLRQFTPTDELEELEGADLYEWEREAQALELLHQLPKLDVLQRMDAGMLFFNSPETALHIYCQAREALDEEGEPLLGDQVLGALVSLMKELVQAKGADAVSSRFMHARDEYASRGKLTVFSVFVQKAHEEQVRLKRRCPRGRAAASMIVNMLGWKFSEQGTYRR